jgi:hypothetical protein
LFLFMARRIRRTCRTTGAARDRQLSLNGSPAMVFLEDYDMAGDGW